MFQLFGDEDDAELSSTGPSEAEMIKQRTAAAEDDRRLREAIRASGGGGGGGGRAPRGGGPANADIDLQRAIEASVQRPQQPPRRR